MKLPRKPRSGICVECWDINDCSMRSAGVTYCAAHKEPKKDYLKEFAEWCLSDRFDSRDIGIRAKFALDKLKEI